MVRGIGYIAILALSFFCVTEAKAQETGDPNKQKLHSSTLQYHPEMPPADSYKIIKNTTGQEVPDSVLLKINMYRKLDKDFVWKVSDEIEVLIFPIHPPKER